jgi:hypothetical protein
MFAPHVSLRPLAVLAVALSTSAAIGCGAGTPAPAPADKTDAAPSLVGRWRSACTQTGDAQSITLDFDIGPSEWKLDYVTYGDATCSAAFVTAHIEGPYEVGARSAVAGAFEGRFGFTKKTLTPDVDAAVGFLGSPQGCGGGAFKVGVATDVLDSGCAGLGQYPRARCGADFDLVSVEGNTLRFGERPKDNDMCTEAKRPKALASLGMARVL